MVSAKKDIRRHSIRQPSGAVRNTKRFPWSMQVTAVVTIPSWLKLPVQGEYVGEDHADKASHCHHVHSDHDDVDRTPGWCQKWPDIQGAVAHFQASRYSRCVCLNTPPDVYPCITHCRSCETINTAQPYLIGRLRHSHTVQLQTEYPDLASVHREPVHRVDVRAHVPVKPVAVHHLKAAELYNPVIW